MRSDLANGKTGNSANGNNSRISGVAGILTIDYEYCNELLPNSLQVAVGGPSRQRRYRYTHLAQQQYWARRCSYAISIAGPTSARAIEEPLA